MHHPISIHDIKQRLKIKISKCMKTINKIANFKNKFRDLLSPMKSKL